GSTKFESRQLRLHPDGPHYSAALNAARLNGRGRQGFRIGEARVRGPNVSVHLMPFDTSRSGFALEVLRPVSLGRRPKAPKLATDAVEDNVQVILPEALVSAEPVGVRRAIIVGFEKLKVGPITAAQALSDVLIDLGFKSERLSVLELKRTLLTTL